MEGRSQAGGGVGERMLLRKEWGEGEGTQNLLALMLTSHTQKLAVHPQEAQRDSNVSAIYPRNLKAFEMSIWLPSACPPTPT